MLTQFIPELMELHRSGNFPIERLCKVYPVEELAKALIDLKNGSVRLIPIDFGSIIQLILLQVIKPIIQY